MESSIAVFLTRQLARELLPTTSQCIMVWCDSAWCESRGESGWCSDVTSIHGAWRHAGVRFLLPGVIFPLTSGHALIGLPVLGKLF